MTKYPLGFSKEDIADSELMLAQVKLEPFENQTTKEDLYAPRPNKWRCSTEGCTYCDPDNYDGWDDEAAARQQSDYDYIHCSIAKSDHDEDIAMSMCED